MGSSKHSRVALAACAVLFSTCSPGGDGARDEGVTMLDSAGVTLVHNTRRDLPSGCVVIAPEPKLTIGPSGTDESGPPPLYRVNGATLQDNGNIVLLNAGTHQLLFFSQSGEFLRAVGGEGRGPGEFVFPSWLGRGLGDTLSVWDARVQRLSTFSGDGDYVTSSRIPEQRPMVEGRFSDGSLLLTRILYVIAFRDGRLKREDRPYLRYDPHSDTTHLLLEAPSNEWVDGEDGSYSLPFGKTGHYLAHGTFLVGGDDGAPVLRYYDLQGRLVQSVSWVSEAIPVTGEDERRYAEEEADGSGRRVLSERGGTVADERTSMLFADQRPRFSGLVGDATGWLWVREYAAPWEPPAGWLVFDQEGALRCRVEMPARFGVYEIGEDYLLGRQTNEVDEESVVLYDLSRSSDHRDTR